jgi:hypothetical protein
VREHHRYEPAGGPGDAAHHVAEATSHLGLDGTEKGVVEDQIERTSFEVERICEDERTTQRNEPVFDG